MTTDHITSHAEILAFCFTGKHRRWIVTAVNGNDIVVDGDWNTGYRRSFSITGRTADRARLELVRKGNTYDDAINQFLITGEYPTRDQSAH